MSESLKETKSQNEIAAQKRIDRIIGYAAAMEVLRQPGGVLKLFDQAKAIEENRRKLVRALTQIRERAVQAIVDIGDERRARGESVALCWLPEGPAAEGIEQRGLDSPKHTVNRE
jgi:hypothetical protein